MIRLIYAKPGQGMSLLAPFDCSGRNGVLFGSSFLLDAFALGGHSSRLHTNSGLHHGIKLPIHFAVRGFSGGSALSAHAVCSIGRNNVDGFSLRASRFAIAVSAFIDRLRGGAAANQGSGDSDSNVHSVVLHNWPAQAYYNREAFVTLAQEISKLPVPPVRAQAERAARADAGSFAAFIESLVLSALPDGNHGEIFAKGQSV